MRREKYLSAIDRVKGKKEHPGNCKLLPLASATRNSHTYSDDEPEGDLEQPEQIYQDQALWQSLLPSVMLFLALYTMGKR